MRNYIRLKDVLMRCACYIRLVEVDSLLMTDGIFVIQEFLMLDEITKSGGALLQDEKSEDSVEIQDLLCYWDKVRLFVLTDDTHSEQPVPVEGSTDMHIMFKYILYALQSLDAPTLQNISLNLTSNQLVAVIGPVGAGKVSLHFHHFSPAAAGG